MLDTITDDYLHWAIDFRAHSIDIQIRSDLFDLPSRILHPVIRSVAAVLLSRHGEKDDGTAWLCLRFRHCFGDRQHLGNTECVIGGAVVNAIVRGKTIRVVMS